MLFSNSGVQGLTAKFPKLALAKLSCPQTTAPTGLLLFHVITSVHFLLLPGDSLVYCDCSIVSILSVLRSHSALCIASIKLQKFARILPQTFPESPYEGDQAALFMVSLRWFQLAMMRAKVRAGVPNPEECSLVTRPGIERCGGSAQQTVDRSPDSQPQATFGRDDDAGLQPQPS